MKLKYEGNDKWSDLNDTTGYVEIYQEVNNIQTARGKGKGPCKQLIRMDTSKNVKNGQKII